MPVCDVICYGAMGCWRARSFGVRLGSRARVNPPNLKCFDDRGGDAEGCVKDFGGKKKKSQLNARLFSFFPPKALTWCHPQSTFEGFGDSGRDAEGCTKDFREKKKKSRLNIRLFNFFPPKALIGFFSLLKLKNESKTLGRRKRRRVN